MKTIRLGQEGEKDLVITLQRLLVKYDSTITPDGVFGKETKQAVMAFQELHQLHADGIVGYRSWEALFFADRDNNQVSLLKEDIELAAKLLECEPASLMAVQQVETGGHGGFLKGGMPVILFEGHVFWEQLKNKEKEKEKENPEQYVAGNENILYERWTKEYYKGGAAEYERLEQARAIDRDAADASASWGMFQIMGFNYAACGEKSVADFVAMMHKSELHQLLLSARFINNNPVLLRALRDKDWTTFARCYNGPGYKQNDYDVKLGKAYGTFCQLYKKEKGGFRKALKRVGK